MVQQMTIYEQLMVSTSLSRLNEGITFLDRMQVRMSSALDDEYLT